MPTSLICSFQLALLFLGLGICYGYTNLLYTQGRAIFPIQGILPEPRHMLDALYLCLFARPSITHVPLLLMRIRTNHPERLISFVIQQTMSDSGRNDNQVTALDRWLKPLRILLPSEAEPCATCNYPEDFVGCGVEMGFAVHGILPLGDNLTDLLEPAPELCGCGVEGPMVNHEGFGLNRGVGDSLPCRDLAAGHLDI